MCKTLVFCMPTNPLQKSFFQRRIPTIAGLFVLVIALVGGIVLVGSDTAQVFSPRATPQTTPKTIKVSNVTDDSFTISFMTDEPTAGFVKYGTEENKLSSQISDDRDQLSGTVGDYKLHHITVRGLTAQTEYYYVLGTGSRSTFDNNGTPFTIKTAQKAGVPSAAKTIYGSVVTASGGPADGAVVYISAPGMGAMSALVKSSGSFAAPLSNARTPDGSAYAQLNDDTTLSLQATGVDSTTSEVSVTLSQAQPVPTITLGQNTVATNEALPSPELIQATTQELMTNNASDSGTTVIENQELTKLSSNSLDTSSTSSQSSSTTASNSAVTSSTTGALGGLLNETTTEATTLDLAEVSGNEKPVLTTSQPVIKGVAAPNVVVNITVNSETQITQQLTADANGEFTLDIEALKKNLEPGEHTVTYSYTDATGNLVEKTVNFTVEPKTSTLLAQAKTSPSPSPFGSGNPFPIGGATSSATATKSATATESAKGGATRSAMPSTSSGIPVSGSVSTTWALIIGGLFFIMAGGWSAWLAKEVDRVVAD